MSFSGPRYYLATMEAMGEEGRQRIARHQALREGKGFVTIERSRNVGALFFEHPGTVLLESLGNLLANEMFSPDGGVEDPVDRLVQEILGLKSRCENLIVVCEETGRDEEEREAGTREYQRALGELTCHLAAQADVVAEVVCGILLPIKGSIGRKMPVEGVISRETSGEERSPDKYR